MTPTEIFTRTDAILEPQVSKNTEPDGSKQRCPKGTKIQPQQARYIVPTSFVRNDIQCLLRDAIPRI